MRLWKIGTDRVLGIYSGNAEFRNGNGEDLELPENLRGKFNPEGEDLFGDFEVCLLEKEKPGQMQAACIESVKNISTGK